jgi:hypothetical protein
LWSSITSAGAEEPRNSQEQRVPASGVPVASGPCGARRRSCDEGIACAGVEEDESRAFARLISGTEVRWTGDAECSAQLDVADGQVRRVVSLEIPLAACAVQFADGGKDDRAMVGWPCTPILPRETPRLRESRTSCSVNDGIELLRGWMAGISRSIALPLRRR